MLAERSEGSLLFTMVFRILVTMFARQLLFPIELFARPATLPLSLKGPSEATSPPVGSALGADSREEQCSASGIEILSILTRLWRYIGVDQGKGNSTHSLGCSDGAVQALHSNSLQCTRQAWVVEESVSELHSLGGKVNFGKDLGGILKIDLINLNLWVWLWWRQDLTLCFQSALDSHYPSLPMLLNCPLQRFSWHSGSWLN